MGNFRKIDYFREKDETFWENQTQRASKFINRFIKRLNKTTQLSFLRFPIKPVEPKSGRDSMTEPDVDSSQIRLAPLPHRRISRIHDY